MEKEQNHTKSVQLVPQHEYLSQRKIGTGWIPLVPLLSSYFWARLRGDRVGEDYVISSVSSGPLVGWEPSY